MYVAVVSFSGGDYGSPLLPARQRCTMNEERIRQAHCNVLVLCIPPLRGGIVFLSHFLIFQQITIVLLFYNAFKYTFIFGKKLRRTPVKTGLVLNRDYDFF